VTVELPQALIWLDPGETTGYAILTPDHQFACGQSQGLYATGVWLDGTLRRYRAGAHIGWEAYRVLGARSAESTVGLRVMGVAQWLAMEYGSRILPEVSSEMRTPASPATLKRLGWYEKGMPHAMDASRHLLAYLMRTGLAPDIVRTAFTEG
jgi:hypothetical protein